MVTRRGWLLLASAGVLWLFGRLFGLLELHVLAVATAVTVAGAVLYVRATPMRLEAARHVHPAQVPLEAACRVDLGLTNASRRTTPALVAEELFDGGRLTAEFSVPALAPGGTGRAAYRVPTTRRGRFAVGPLRLRLEDPFGLAYRQASAGPPGIVLVHPRVDPVRGLPPAPGSDPHGGVPRQAGRHQGEDFYALRPYEVGDDLRRVHWPASARSDELMIRQLELPWQHRVTVVLDVRRAVHSPESFETAVSAAASIFTASQRDGALVRLVTTAGFDSGFGAGSSHWSAAMAHLAAVGTTGDASLAATLASLARRSPGSGLAVVTGAGVGAGDRRAVAGMRERSGLVVLVLVAGPGQAGTGQAGTGQDGTGPGRAGTPGGDTRGVRVVRVGPSRPFSAAWAEAGLRASA